MEVAELREALGPGQPEFRAKQIYHALYSEHVGDLVRISTLPAPLRTSLAASHTVGLPKLARLYESSDGTKRYLLELEDQRTIEAVLMPEEGRDTICISSQVGCPVDCKFCLTALMGLERNLIAGEIVGQVLAVQRYLSHSSIALTHPGPAKTGPFTPGALTNLVLMGMGEPLANPEAVEESIRRITDRRWGLGFSPRRITLSTAGLAPRLNRVADLGINLAVSLNATTEAQRNRLMPAANHAYSLKALLDACRKYPLKPRQRLTFEYVLLKNENDSEDDALRLAHLVRNIRCKINLIPFNEFPGSSFQRPSEDAILRFQSIVTRRGLDVFIRKSKGREVLGACGQLGSLSPPLVRPLRKQPKRGAPAPALASAPS